jgi:F0F1-type ATP synthase membrane subunit b/b'
MAFFEDMFKGANIGTGLAVGVGVAVIGPLVTPIIAGILRPAAKAVVKAGIVAYDAGRESFAQLNEATGDIVAEARSEVNETRPPATEHPREVPDRRPKPA